MALVALCPLMMTRWVSNCFQTPKVAVLVTLGLPLTFLALVDLSNAVLRGTRKGLDWWEKALFFRWITLTAATAASISVSLSFWGDPGRCHGWISRVLVLGVALVVYRCVQERPGRLRQLLAALVASSLPVSLYALSQAAGWDPLIPELPHDRPFSTMGNAAFLGDVLQFAFFSAWGLVFTERRGKARFLWFAAAAASGTALLATLTRSAWLGTGVGLCLGLLLLARTRRLPRPSRLFLWTVPLACLAILFFCLAGYGRHILQRVLETVSLDLTGTGRLLIWEDAWEMGKERWLKGSGLETFALAFLPERSLGLARFNPVARYDNAHCEILNRLCTEGVLGLSSYLLLAWMGLRGVWRSFHRGTLPFLSLALLSSLVAHAVSGLFNFDVIATSLLWYAFLAAGAALDSPKASPLYTGGALSKVVLGALFVSGISVSGRLLWADHVFSLANGYFYVGNAQEASTYARRAHRLAPWNSDYQILLADSLGPKTKEAEQLYDTILKERSSPQMELVLEKKTSFQLARGELEGALNTLEDLLRLDPHSSTAHLLNSYALAGIPRPQDALLAVEKARFLDPWNEASLHFEKLLAPLFQTGALGNTATGTAWEKIHPVRIVVDSPSTCLVLGAEPGAALACAQASRSSATELLFPLFREDQEWSACFHLYADSSGDGEGALEVIDKQGHLVSEEVFRPVPIGCCPSSWKNLAPLRTAWVRIRSEVPLYGWELLRGRLGEQVVMGPSLETEFAGLPLPRMDDSFWLGLSLVNPSGDALQCRLELVDSSRATVSSETIELGPGMQRILVDGTDLPERDEDQFLTLQGDKPFHVQAVLGGASKGVHFGCGLRDLSLKTLAFFPLFGSRYGGKSRLLAANPSAEREAAMRLTVFREEQPARDTVALVLPPRGIVDLASRLTVHQDFGLKVDSSLPLCFLEIVEWQAGPRPGIVAHTGDAPANSVVAPFPTTEASGFLAVLPSDAPSNRIRLLPLETPNSPLRRMEFHFRGRLLFPLPSWLALTHTPTYESRDRLFVPEKPSTSRKRR